MKSKKLSRLLKIQAIVFAVVVAVGTCSVGAFAYNCSRVRSDVLRMHVIANSDSDGDQALKLKVRDAVLERGAELFDGTVTADEAKAKIEPQKAELEAAAREVIEREGYDYPVSVNVVNEYFATRCYGDLTMPAGRYTAVKVVTEGLLRESSKYSAFLKNYNLFKTISPALRTTIFSHNRGIISCEAPKTGFIDKLTRCFI